MNRHAGNAPDAPAAVGPYSHFVTAGDLVFVSGQIPLDPASGTLVAGDAAAQARRCLENLKLVLAAAGSSLDRVCRCGLFLVDMADFAAVNAVYAEFFPHDPPARTTLAVAALPAGARVEIEAIALRA